MCRKTENQKGKSKWRKKTGKICGSYSYFYLPMFDRGIACKSGTNRHGKCYKENDSI